MFRTASAAPLAPRSEFYLSSGSIFSLAGITAREKAVKVALLMLVFSAPAGMVLCAILYMFLGLQDALESRAAFGVYSTTVDWVDRWRMAWIRLRRRAAIAREQRRRKARAAAWSWPWRSKRGKEVTSSQSLAECKSGVPATKRPDSLLTVSTVSTLPLYPGSGRASVASDHTVDAQERPPGYH
jgi:hypothetical protein